MNPPPAGEIPDPGPRPRYGTRPFPAYRYVPGRHPHPRRDPQGHSFGAPQGRLGDEWVHGVDLFNARYFWEAHEAWEALWLAHDRSSTPALFFQGLIQIAAALLKTHMGATEGARSLSRDGLAKLRQAAAISPAMMGLDLPSTIAELERWFAQSPADVASAPVLRLSAA